MNRIMAWLYLLVMLRSLLGWFCFELNVSESLSPAAIDINRCFSPKLSRLAFRLSTVLYQRDSVLMIWRYIPLKLLHFQSSLLTLLTIMLQVFISFFFTTAHSLNSAETKLFPSPGRNTWSPLVKAGRSRGFILKSCIEQQQQLHGGSFRSPATNDSVPHNAFDPL